MGHYKRKRPKNRRAGCLMCKPWKMNGWGRNRHDVYSRSPKRLSEAKDIEEQLKSSVANAESDYINLNN